MSATTTVSVIGGVAFGRRSTSGLAVMCLAAALLLASTAGFAQVIVPAGEGAPDTGSPGASGSAHGSKYIVQFTPETPRSARAQVVQQAGAAVRHELDIIDAIAVTVPNQNVLKGLMNNQSVRRVVPDHPLYEAAPKTPPIPVNLTATRFSSSQINLGWSEGDGNPEDGFRIERCTGDLASCNDVNFGTLTSVGANVLGYSDTGLPADTTFAYRVIAFTLSGKPSERDSAPSDGDAATTTQPPPPTLPAAPSNLSASTVSSNQIDLIWNDTIDEDEFLIERCQGSGCSGFSQIDTAGAGVTNYSDMSLTALTTYRYRVLASNAAGPSGPSNTDSATTLDDPPPPMSSGGTRQLISFAVKRVGGPCDVTGVGVGVLDSGCDLNHRDQACTPMVDYHTITGQDDRGHGTAVIGLINAPNNNYDTVGVAPGATVYSYKTLASNGSGDESFFVSAIGHILNNPELFNPPVGVINISSGRDLQGGELMEDTPLCLAATAARSAGIVVVVSAGNGYSQNIDTVTPAGCAAVFAVGSTTAADGIDQCPGDFFNPTGYAAVPADSASGFTNIGTGITVSAPGEGWNDTVYLSTGCNLFMYGVLSTTLGGAQGADPTDPPGATRKIPTPSGAFETRGTSFAAPLVTGIVAYMKQLGIGGGTGDMAEVETIRTELRNTADRSFLNPDGPTDPPDAPTRHPWSDLNWPPWSQTDDGQAEGIAQVPTGP